MVSCQKGPTRHAYAWQIGPFWQDTLDDISLKLPIMFELLPHLYSCFGCVTLGVKLLNVVFTEYWFLPGRVKYDIGDVVGSEWAGLPLINIG